jgi:hypothetical protein
MIEVRKAMTERTPDQADASRSIHAEPSVRSSLPSLYHSDDGLSVLEHDGLSVDYSKTLDVRDRMEQAAARLSGLSPEENKAVSEYLAGIQKPDVSAEALIIETNKLQDRLSEGKDPAYLKSDNSRFMLDMGILKEGVAAANNLNPYGENVVEERLLTGISRAVHGVEKVSSKLGL